jgi:hypothetical protein
MKGASSASKIVQRKKGVQEEHIRAGVREIIRTKQLEGILDGRNKKKGVEPSVLDRFKRKIV